jgi:transposase
MFIDEIINSDIYIAILRDNLLPFIDELIADGTTDIIFQQDNAHPHISKKTHQFLMNAAREHGFLVMEWPPNSPDMNPIEHLWSHIKLELHHRYPDTKTLPGHPETVKRVLKE